METLHKSVVLFLVTAIKEDRCLATQSQYIRSHKYRANLIQVSHPKVSEMEKHNKEQSSEVIREPVGNIVSNQAEDGVSTLNTYKSCQW